MNEGGPPQTGGSLHPGSRAAQAGGVGDSVTIRESGIPGREAATLAAVGRGLTRSEFLRLGSAGGAGLLFAAGNAEAASRFLGSDGIAATPRARRPRLHARRVQTFVSRPHLKPPTVTVVKPAADVAHGSLFLAPSSGPGQRGVMILDNTGRLVWFRPTNGTAMNVRAATYKGEPVLTWWEGKSEHGLSDGHHVIVDSSYTKIASFPAGNGFSADMHEFIVTPQGTALITAWELRTMNLSRLGGPRRHPVIGGMVQELEIPSARVLFEWRSLDHVALSESHQRVGLRYDYFHINSVDIAHDDNLIVSARNTWAVYKLNRRTGAVMWRLGGKRSDFEMGRGTVFAWQHDARTHDDGRTISVFDNGAAPEVKPQSRAIVLALDEKRRRATLQHRYVHHPNALQAHAMGNAQLLDNGDLLVGWGAEPYFTEFAPDGTIRFDARLPRGGQNYRVLRFPWSGTPSIPPQLVAKGRVVYASWNGATDLASWRLRTGTSAATLNDAGETVVRAFETAFRVPAEVTHAAVVALAQRHGARHLRDGPRLTQPCH